MTTLTAGTWTIDPTHTEIGFSVRHIMSKVRGKFGDLRVHPHHDRGCLGIVGRRRGRAQLGQHRHPRP